MQKYLTKMFECIPDDQGKYYHIKLRLRPINNNIINQFRKKQFLIWVVLDCFDKIFSLAVPKYTIIIETFSALKNIYLWFH